MALLKLPKQFDPYLGHPGRKPVGPVEIDWSNPLTRGLVECYVFIGGVCVNLVDGFIGSPSSGVSFKANNAVFNNNSKITLKGPTPVYGAFTVTGRLKPNTINFDGIWGDKDGTTFGQDNGAGINIRSDGALAFKVGLDDTRSAASSLTAGNATTFSCTYNLDGSENQKIFFNGKETASYQAQQVSSAYSLSSVTSRLGTYFSEGSSWSYDGEMEFIFVHSRRISDLEIAALHRDAYQILKTANDLVYFTPVAAAGAYTLTAESGSYTVTGSAANLEHHRVMSAASGSYAVTGSAVTLTVGTAGSYTLVAESGSYTVTGSSANLEHHRVMSAASGAYTVTGSSANLEHHRLLSADSGAYTVTGSSVALTKTYILTAEPGSYVYTGSNANLIVEELRTPDCFTWLLSSISEASYLNSEIDNSALYVESTIDDSATFLTSEIKEALYLTGELCS